MILGWGYSGTYPAEELHDGLAGVAELRAELLEVMGGNGQTLRTNYIAHGLRALTIDGAHKKIDGVYHQTERGRIFILYPTRLLSAREAPCNCLREELCAGAPPEADYRIEVEEPLTASASQ